VLEKEHIALVDIQEGNWNALTGLVPDDIKHSDFERIVLLDFIHRLVSQKTNKIEELKI